MLRLAVRRVAGNKAAISKDFKLVPEDAAPSKYDDIELEAVAIDDEKFKCLASSTW